MSGASVYQMISGLGDAFGDAYANARKQAQDDEAPALISGLLAAQGGAVSSPAASPVAAAEADTGPKLPTFAGLSGANPSADRKINGTNADFVSAMMPHALEASKATGVDPRIILAQSAIETGWGKSAPGNNYFGIKSHGAAGGNTMATTEVVNGQPVRISDSFRAFPDMAASAAGYGDFINKNPRYAGLKQAQGLEAQATALQRSGYATDPNYGAKVLSVARRLPSPGGVPSTAPVAFASNEAETQALERNMGMLPDQAAADLPAQGAVPTGFRIPGADAPTPPTGFAGFGSGAARMSPEMRAALNAAWKNPNTRSIASSMMSSMLAGKDASWQLSTMGDQPVLFNSRTAQVIPVGQAKRSTATVGNVVIDTNTGEPIYQGDQEPKTATVDGTIVDTRTGQPIYSAPAKPVTVSAGSTLVDPSTGKPIFSAPTAEKDEAAKITAQIAAREAEGQRLGLTPGTPTAQTYALTGKIGRDQDLSATDKKAILDADEKVLAIEGTLTSLGRAKELSKDAYSGPMASTRGYLGSMVGLDRGNKTQELDNTITSQALDSLKATFGAAPTEGERKILLEIQGSSSQAPEVRAKIYERAELALQKRLAFEKSRAEDLRGGTFYKKDGAPGPGKPAVAKGAERVAIPEGKSAGMAVAEARAFVKANPATKAQIADRLRSWGIDPARLD